MILNFKKHFFVLSSLLMLSLMAQSTSIEIKQGDVLSEVLKKKGLNPVYGEKGSLNKVIDLNSSLKSSQGNFISPGTIILLEPELKTEENENKNEVDDVETKSFPLQPTNVAIEGSDPQQTLWSQVDFSKYFWGLSASGQYSQVSGTYRQLNSSIKLVSDLSPTTYFFAGLKLNDQWSTYLGVEHQFLKLMSPDDSITKLIAENKNLGRYILNVKYDLVDDTSLYTQLNYFDAIVVRSPFLNFLQIDAVSQPQVAFGLEYKLLNNHPFQIKTDISYLVNLAVQNHGYDIKNSQGYFVGLNAGYKIDQFLIEAMTSFRKNQLKTDAWQIEKEDFSFGIGMTIRN